jgi:hypothetical protein
MAGYPNLSKNNGVKNREGRGDAPCLLIEMMMN